MAEDPVKVAPDIYKVLLENDRVRVLDTRVKPSQKSSMHSHPPCITYALNDGKVRFTSPDGTSTDVELRAGEAVWSEAETHEVDNLGTTEVHVLNIELK